MSSLLSYFTEDELELDSLPSLTPLYGDCDTDICAVGWMYGQTDKQTRTRKLIQ